MKKVLLLFYFFSSLLFSSDVTSDDVKDWNEAGQYNRICSDNVRSLFINEQSDSLANMYAKACLKVDKINDLAIPIVMLYKDQESRENAVIYSTILFQKKLLYFALIDGFDISYVKTPKIDYVLSEIFDKFVDGDYEKTSDKYLFDLKDDVKCYVFIKEEKNIKKMVFEIYKKDKLISVKTYW